MMQDWFVDARFGIFLHWGIYSVGETSESWAFFNGDISYDDYMAQGKAFAAEHYDPQSWADLFKKSGAQYAVLTTKHHDGVALWDTELSELNVVDSFAPGRDLIAPYCAALREKGLRVGLYFSHLDWSHPDYASIPPHAAFKKRNRFNDSGKDDRPGWARFLEFHRGQLRELCERFEPDLLWFDGDWERTAEDWDMAGLRAQLDRWAPQAVLNSRLQGHGDYATPEQGLPIARPDGHWEFCMTLNDSWGYRKNDDTWKSTRFVLKVLVDCIHRGGRLLLNVGPRADGTFPPEVHERLGEIGGYNTRYREAVFESAEGLPHGHCWHPTTVGKDGRCIYIFLWDQPRENLLVKGLRSKIERIRVLHHGGELAWRIVGGAPWANVPGTTDILLPEALPEDVGWVLALDLAEPLDLYREKSGAIEQNA